MYTTNPIETGLGSNPNISGDNSATSPLSHVMAITKVDWPIGSLVNNGLKRSLKEVVAAWLSCQEGIRQSTKGQSR